MCSEPVAPRRGTTHDDARAIARRLEESMKLGLPPKWQAQKDRAAHAVKPDRAKWVSRG
jgi:hypothetical protein